MGSIPVLKPREVAQRANAADEPSDRLSAVPEVLVIYDKQCPACDHYCNLVRIRESVGRLVLVDARLGGPVMEEITAAGLDIDQGMVVKVGKGKVIHPLLGQRPRRLAFAAELVC